MSRLTVQRVFEQKSGTPNPPAHGPSKPTSRAMITEMLDGIYGAKEAPVTGVAAAFSTVREEAVITGKIDLPAFPPESGLIPDGELPAAAPTIGIPN